MQRAEKNIEELLGELGSKFNRLRRDSINEELFDIVSGFEAMKQGFQKRVTYCFLVHALVTPLIAVVYFYPNFSDKLLLIGIPWAITAPVLMLMLALLFKKELISDLPKINSVPDREAEQSKQQTKVLLKQSR